MLLFFFFKGEDKGHEWPFSLPTFINPYSFVLELFWGFGSPNLGTHLSPADLYTHGRVIWGPAKRLAFFSFLYLFYTLINLYYTKALSDQASSLAPDWISLLQRPRIADFHGSITTFHYKLSTPSKCNSYAHIALLTMFLQLFLEKFRK